jgi:hypothetical protein
MPPLVERIVEVVPENPIKAAADALLHYVATLSGVLLAFLLLLYPLTRLLGGVPQMDWRPVPGLKNIRLSRFGLCTGSRCAIRQAAWAASSKGEPWIGTLSLSLSQ